MATVAIAEPGSEKATGNPEVSANTMIAINKTRK